MGTRSSFSVRWFVYLNLLRIFCASNSPNTKDLIDRSPPHTGQVLLISLSASRIKGFHNIENNSRSARAWLTYSGRICHFWYGLEPTLKANSFPPLLAAVLLEADIFYLLVGIGGLNYLLGIEGIDSWESWASWRSQGSQGSPASLSPTASSEFSAFRESQESCQSGGSWGCGESWLSWASWASTLGIWLLFRFLPKKYNEHKQDWKKTYFPLVTDRSDRYLYSRHVYLN